MLEVLEMAHLSSKPVSVRVFAPKTHSFYLSSMCARFYIPAYSQRSCLYTAARDFKLSLWFLSRLIWTAHDRIQQMDTLCTTLPFNT